MFLETAAAFAGISRSTLNRWLRRGAKKGSGIYRQFRRDALRALAQVEMRGVLTIGKAAQTHWQASAWLLERRWPERWGRTSRERAVESKDRPSPEQLAAQIREFLKQSADPSPETPPT